jgi:hypothetical protein
MPYGRARRATNYGEFWPGYVDVLSTLLLVVTFLLSVFMVAQFYVSQEVSGKGHGAETADAADRRDHQPAQPGEGPRPLA